MNNLFSRLASFLSRMVKKIKYQIFNISYSNAYQQWRKQNENSDFADYYVAKELNILKGYRSHPTLGGNLRKGAFQSQGKKGIFKLMKEDGLAAHHICVDYGCGSLRVGQHLIHYLDQGNYYGLDVTDAFIKMGVELVDPATLSQKKPVLELISPAILSSIAERGAAYVFSVGVLLHVPPEELGVYFEQLLSLFNSNTKMYIALTSYKENMQCDELSWAYQKEFIKEELLKRQPGAKVDFLNFKDVSLRINFKNRTFQRGIVRLIK